ncbi:MAG: hypothetical protein P4M07_16360, partial [Xanthobacteraceae bacterium]|nr:hypothetical protein [Xanthobacteraceae bacterium]
LACAFSCRRFALALAADGARLGASAVRYTFTAEDFHLLLLAGLTGAQPGIHNHESQLLSKHEPRVSSTPTNANTGVMVSGLAPLSRRAPE